MNIRPPGPPPDSVQQAQEGVIELLGASSRPGQSARFAAETQQDRVELTAPHQVYVLSREDLFSKGGLEQAKSVGWRYLVITDQGGIVGAAETAEQAESHDHQFVSLSRDSNLEVVPGVIRQIEETPTEWADEFELRLLRVPAAYSVNIWLHGQTNDLLVPVPPTPPYLETGHIYGWDEVLDVLRQDSKIFETDETQPLEE